MLHYALGRREVIPEGRFNVQEEMGSNKNMVSDQIHAKLKKMHKAVSIVSNSWG